MKKIKEILESALSKLNLAGINAESEEGQAFLQTEIKSAMKKIAEDLINPYDYVPKFAEGGIVGSGARYINHESESDYTKRMLIYEACKKDRLN